ncbi:unnamed protein product, partial [Musa acuminata var. zebrina]
MGRDSRPPPIRSKLLHLDPRFSAYTAAAATADALAAMEKPNNVQFDGKQMHIYVMLPKGLPFLLFQRCMPKF